MSIARRQKNTINLSNDKPSTSGNVILQTSMGNIEIELYWDHAFKTCQNFRTLACRGYYNNTIFHRIIKVLSIFYPHTYICYVVKIYYIYIYRIL